MENGSPHDQTTMVCNLIDLYLFNFNFSIVPIFAIFSGVGVAVLNDLLYAVGGHDGTSYLNSIERYDPQTNQWSAEVAPTSSCRTSVGVAVLDGFLYAVGGQDGVSCLNHVER